MMLQILILLLISLFISLWTLKWIERFYFCFCKYKHLSYHSFIKAINYLQWDHSAVCTSQSVKFSCFWGSAYYIIDSQVRIDCISSVNLAASRTTAAVFVTPLLSCLSQIFRKFCWNYFDNKKIFKLLLLRVKLWCFLPINCGLSGMSEVVR